MVVGGASTDTLSDTSESSTSLRVLIVDDDPICGTINKHILATQLHVQFDPKDLVSNGLECVERLSTEEYDLIVIDIDMPVMTGVEAIFHIRGLNPYTTTVTDLAAGETEGADSEEDIPNRFADLGISSSSAAPGEPANAPRNTDTDLDSSPDEHPSDPNTSSSSFFCTHVDEFEIESSSTSSSDPEWDYDPSQTSAGDVDSTAASSFRKNTPDLGPEPEKDPLEPQQIRVASSSDQDQHHTRSSSSSLSSYSIRPDTLKSMFQQIACTTLDMEIPTVLDSNRNVPIIVLSTISDAGFTDYCRNALSVNAVVEKPVKCVKTFARIVTDVLEGGR
ncbi:hypothetical protein HK102_004081 [Quaeritorhiza haematococci]|nr:hypothetical protein HK102_004081 [Quaeritorhiza haematococci]